MKIHRMNVEILLKEIQKLEEIQANLKRVGGAWCDADTPGEAAYYRASLESLLEKFRQKMAIIYDFQHERGLVDADAPNPDIIGNFGVIAAAHGQSKPSIDGT